jgi:hypothetical protein
VFLPFQWRTTVAESLFSEYWTHTDAWPFAGAWPFALVTAAVLGSCAAVLAALRRSSRTSVPRGIRLLHLLTATLAVGLFAFWVGVMLHDRGDLSFLEAGSWIFTAGCAALIHSTVRLWRPGASTRALLQR